MCGSLMLLKNGTLVDNQTYTVQDGILQPKTRCTN